MAMVQETIKLKALGYIISVVIELRIIFILKNQAIDGMHLVHILCTNTVLAHAGTKMRWQLLACGKFIILLEKTVIAHQTSTGQYQVNYKSYRHSDSS